MKTTTPYRRLGLAAAVALSGGMLFAGVSTATAATSGNLETKGPLYYCEDGYPQMVVYVRPTKTDETVSYTSSPDRGDGQWNLSAGDSYGQVYSRGSSFAGYDGTITFKGSETDSSLTVNVNIPERCGDLPKERPESGWEGTAVQPTSVPTSSTSSSSSSTTASPTSTDSPTGPPVQTGYEPKDSSNAGALALIGMLAAGAAVTGTAATRRLGGR